MDKLGPVFDLCSGNVMFTCQCASENMLSWIEKGLSILWYVLIFWYSDSDTNTNIGLSPKPVVWLNFGSCKLAMLCGPLKVNNLAEIFCLGPIGPFRFIQSILVYSVHLVPLRSIRALKNGKRKVWVETSTYSKSDY